MFAERLFRFTIVAWIGNPLPIGINDKGIKPNINADSRFDYHFHGVGDFYAYLHIPARRFTANGQILNFTIGQWSMIPNLEVSDFRDNGFGKLTMHMANQLF